MAPVTPAHPESSFINITSCNFQNINELLITKGCAPPECSQVFQDIDNYLMLYNPLKILDNV